MDLTETAKAAGTASGSPPSLPASAAARDAPNRIRRTSLVTRLCWVGLLAEGYDIGILGAVLPKLLENKAWNLSAYAAGLLAGAALAGMFVGAFAVGILSDRFGRRPSFLICLGLFSAAMGASALAPTPELFGLFRFICGIGVGGIVPVAAALTTEFAPPERRSHEFGLMYTGYSLGIFAAALTSFFLVDHYGWRPMIGIGAAPLLALPALIAYLPESVSFLVASGKHERAARTASRFGIPVPAVAPSSAAQAPRALPSTLFAARYRLATFGFWTATFASMLVIYGLNTWLPQFMRTAGYELGPSILFLGVFALASAGGGIVLGTLADRHGQRRVIVSAFAFGACAIGALSLHGPLAITYLVVACAGVGTVSAAVVVTSYLARYFPVQLRATAVGSCLSFSRFGALTGPMIGALLMSEKLPAAWNFWLFAAFALLAALSIAIVPTGSDEP